MNPQIVGSPDGGPRVGEARDDQWAECLRGLHVPDLELLSVSEYDSRRRAYRGEEGVYKVLLDTVDRVVDGRAQNMTGEHEVLRRAQGIRGVPRPLRLVTSPCCQALVLELMPGRVLDDQDGSLKDTLRVTLRLTAILLQLAWRGISHNDVVPSNVLVGDDGQISLIDFDQATSETRRNAVMRQLLGVNTGGKVVYGSMRTIVRQGLRHWVPAGARVTLGRQVARLHPTVRRERRLPTLANDATPRARSVYEAWRLAQRSSANAPGTPVAYYAFDLDGYHFPGERSWSERWDYLRSVTVYEDKRVLELGCNMGLLSDHLLTEGGASKALAIDVDQEILQSARLVSTAMGVTPEFRCVNLDDAGDWESALAAYQPDVVFALNVVQWVTNKDRLLAFLGRFNELVYEGHDPFEIEQARLSAVGFDVIRLVQTSERGRPVIHCVKS